MTFIVQSALILIKKVIISIKLFHYRNKLQGINIAQIKWRLVNYS